MHRLDLLCFAPPFRFSLRTMRYFASQVGAFTIVAETDGAMVGFVMIEMDLESEPASGYVVTLDVHPGSRRTGVAAALMAQAEQRAVEAGAAQMLLHVYSGNEGAVRFYERIGYRSVSHSRDFYGAGLDAWIYAKTLV